MSGSGGRTGIGSDHSTRQNRREVIDSLIQNIADPRNREQLRIIQIVENQLDRIQDEVKQEVMEKLKNKKHSQEIEETRDRYLRTLKKSEDFCNENQVIIPSPPEKIKLPKVSTSRIPVPGKKNVNQNIPRKTNNSGLKDLLKKENENTAIRLGKTLERMDIHVPRDDIFGKPGKVEYSTDFVTQAPPIIIDKSKSGRNRGIFHIKDKENHTSRKLSKLTAHLLPGVNIRPQLVIESIPGLYFSGERKKKNSKISVQYMTATKEDEEEIEEETSQTVNEEISITDSTTSKFEAVEKIVESNSLENDLKVKLKQKVFDILAHRYGLTPEKDCPAVDGNLESFSGGADNKTSQCRSPPRNHAVIDCEEETFRGKASPHEMIDEVPVKEPSVSYSTSFEEESASSTKRQMAQKVVEDESGAKSSENYDDDTFTNLETESKNEDKKSESIDENQVSEEGSHGDKSPTTHLHNEGESENVSELSDCPDISDNAEIVGQQGEQDEKEIRERVGMLSTIDEVTSVEYSNLGPLSGQEVGNSDKTLVKEGQSISIDGENTDENLQSLEPSISSEIYDVEDAPKDHFFEGKKSKVFDIGIPAATPMGDAENENIVEGSKQKYSELRVEDLSRDEREQTENLISTEVQVDRASRTSFKSQLLNVRLNTKDVPLTGDHQTPLQIEYLPVALNENETAVESSDKENLTEDGKEFTDKGSAESLVEQFGSENEREELIAEAESIDDGAEFVKAEKADSEKGFPVDSGAAVVEADSAELAKLVSVGADCTDTGTADSGQIATTATESDEFLPPVEKIDFELDTSSQEFAISEGELSQEISFQLQEEKTQTGAISFVQGPSSLNQPSPLYQTGRMEATLLGSGFPSLEPSISQGEVVRLASASEGEVLVGLPGEEGAESLPSLDLTTTTTSSSNGSYSEERNGELGGKPRHLGSSRSSVSEGEWRASPKQLQKLYSMASAFQLLKK